MADLQDRIVEFLERTGKPAGLRELLRQLGLAGEARRDLKLQLRQLLADGRVVAVRGARVGLPDRMNLVVGRLTCNAGGFGFVVPERSPGQAPAAARSRAGDVYVAAVNLRDALHGDRVVARVERHTPKGAEGRIIRVLERHLTRVVGRYEEDDGGSGAQPRSGASPRGSSDGIHSRREPPRLGGHVVPFDKRVLHEIFVPPGEAGEAAGGQMVVAEITRPPSATRNPVGRVLQVLGRLEERGVDLRVVMARHELPEAFPPEVEAEAGKVAAEPGAEELAGRTDFRPWNTVTIDPATARDHDDAVSLDRLPNGNWLLGVHIADVAHYVREGGALDQEAYLRGFSVYFPETVVPMLPHALSSHMCSLVEGHDRLSQTAVLEVDPQGRVRRAEFHDGVIRVDAKLSYEQAQAIVDGDPELRQRFAAVTPLVQRMSELAAAMRRRRYQRGALDLDIPEPRLVLDEAGNMTGIRPSVRLDSMRVVEEFMLAANEAVAEHLHGAGVGALYRIHEQPDPGRVEEFCELAASFGYRLSPPGATEVRPQDFQLVLRQIQGQPEEKLISALLLRTMQLARYHEENLGHFGLATEMYAHFTSPIRRYPDLVVHRALRALRQGRAGGLPPRERLAEMGLHLSDRERRAMEAERELVEWKKARFMAAKLGERFKGWVTGVQAFGLFVELDEVYVQGLVHVSSMSDDYYAFDEKAHRLKGESTGRVYRLGDRVEVQVARVDLERRQIDFALVDVLERPRAPRAARPRGERPADGRQSASKKTHGSTQSARRR